MIIIALLLAMLRPSGCCDSGFRSETPYSTGESGAEFQGSTYVYVQWNVLACKQALCCNHCPECDNNANSVSGSASTLKLGQVYAAAFTAEETLHQLKLCQQTFIAVTNSNAAYWEKHSVNLAVFPVYCPGQGDWPRPRGSPLWPLFGGGSVEQWGRTDWGHFEWRRLHSNAKNCLLCN